METRPPNVLFKLRRPSGRPGSGSHLTLPTRLSQGRRWADETSQPDGKHWTVGPCWTSPASEYPRQNSTREMRAWLREGGEKERQQEDRGRGNAFTASVCTQETQALSLGPEDPVEIWNTLVCLREKSHGQRSLAGYSPWGRKESGATAGLTVSQLLHGDEIPAPQTLASLLSSLTPLLPGCEGGRGWTCEACAVTGSPTGGAVSSGPGDSPSLPTLGPWRPEQDPQAPHPRAPAPPPPLRCPGPRGFPPRPAAFCLSLMPATTASCFCFKFCSCAEMNHFAYGCLG